MDYLQLKRLTLSQIEQEFGEPFDEVVRGFRAQGATWVTIAGSLEITPHQLKRWVSERGLWDGKLNRDAPQPNGLHERAQAHGFANVTEMIRDYLNRRQPVYAVAGVLNCATDKLYRYVPDEFKGLIHNQPTPRRLAYYERIRRHDDQLQT